MKMVNPSILNKSMVVYCITNTINGKMYIGATRGKLRVRINKHRFNIGRKHTLLYKAMDGLDASSFSVTILAECTSIGELNEMEKRFIREYGTMDRDKGYNIHPGGPSGSCFPFLTSEEALEYKKNMKLNRKPRKPITEETKKRIGDAQRGKCISKECRIKISKALKEGYASGKIKSTCTTPPSRKGCHLTDDQKKKMSLAKKGKTWEQLFSKEGMQNILNSRKAQSGRNSPYFKEISIVHIVMEILAIEKPTQKKISSLLHVSIPTLYARLQEYGWTFGKLKEYLLNENGN